MAETSASPQPADPGLALEPHLDALYRYARRRTASPELAEELVGDTLVAALERKAQWPQIANLEAWLITMLRNKLLDHYRRQPREQVPDGSELEAAMFTKGGAWRHDPRLGLSAATRDEANAEAKLQQQQLWQVVRRCIDKLPKMLHAILVSHDVAEESRETVCAACGVKPESLSVYLYRARQSVRACVQGSDA